MPAVCAILEQTLLTLVLLRKLLRVDLQYYNLAAVHPRHSDHRVLRPVSKEKRKNATKRKTETIGEQSWQVARTVRIINSQTGRALNKICFLSKQTLSHTHTQCPQSWLVESSRRVQLTIYNPREPRRKSGWGSARIKKKKINKTMRRRSRWEANLQDERRLFRKGDSRHRRPTGAPASFLKWAFAAILRQESLQTRLGKQRYSSERAFLFFFSLGMQAGSATISTSWWDFMFRSTRANTWNHPLNKTSDAQRNGDLWPSLYALRRNASLSLQKQAERNRLKQTSSICWSHSNKFEFSISTLARSTGANSSATTQLANAKSRSTQSGAKTGWRTTATLEDQVSISFTSYQLCLRVQRGSLRTVWRVTRCPSKSSFVQQVHWEEPAELRWSFIHSAAKLWLQWDIKNTRHFLQQQDLPELLLLMINANKTDRQPLMPESIWSLLHFC